MERSINLSSDGDGKKTSSSHDLRKSSATSSLNALRRSHHFDSDQNPREWKDQQEQARTNEAAFSRSEWERMRWVDNDQLPILADYGAQHKHSKGEARSWFVESYFESIKRLSVFVCCQQ